MAPARSADPIARPLLKLETYVDDDGTWCAQVPPFAVVVRDRVLLGVYRGALSVAEYEAVNEAALARVTAAGRKLWMIVVMAPELGVPSPALHARARGVIKRLGPYLLGDAVVIQGTGVLRAAMRAALGTLETVVGPDWPHKTFATLDDAVAWLESQARATDEFAETAHALFAWVPLMVRALSAVPAGMFTDVEAAAAASDPLVGNTLAGRYVVLRRLGAGGMGVVYEARDTLEDLRVAVKVLRRAGDGRHTVSLDDFARFEREARAASLVAHPNVARVLDAGRDAEWGVVFCVQQLLAGETLRARLEARAPLAVAEARALLEPVMEALVVAHEAGVVHRDVKPENIIVAQGDGPGTPYLVDFGIARLADDAADVVSRLTRTGTTLGTAGYMAPEQIRGARDADGRADVWSMGAIWHEALAGRALFAGGGYNEVIARVLTETPAALCAARPELPEALCAAIDRAVAPRLDERHASMRAFLDAVRAALA